VSADGGRGGRAADDGSGTPPSVGPRSESQASEARGGPPPLRPFGLRLHHDGRWSHEGQPIRNRRLREHFDRNVAYLPAERKFVVRLRHFRGEIEVEEAAFFVRSFESGSGRIGLSDGSDEALDPATLALSPRDGALLCRVKRALVPGGVLARFGHGPHAELMQAVEEQGDGLALRIAGVLHPLPELAPLAL
jgi:hypothetical protein